MNVDRTNELFALYQVLRILLPYSIEDRMRILHEAEKRLALEKNVSRCFIPPGASVH